MNRVVTIAVGTLVESWQELRVHRGRVVLSLVGVTIAVASLAVVVGFGQLAERATAAANEQFAGRPATFAVSGTLDAGSAGGPDSGLAGGPDGGEALDRAFREAAVRYGVRFASEATLEVVRVQFPDGVREVQASTVDPAYAEMHRIRIAAGSWLSEADRERLAPAIVVNRAFLDRLGGVDVASSPTVRLPGSPMLTAVVVGEYAASEWDTDPAFYRLAPAPSPAVDDEVPSAPRSYELWLPERGGAAVAARVASDVERALGDGWSVTADRMDAAGVVGADPLGPTRAVIAGVSVLVLLLGGLGLLNVALVSVRQRIREIGIRRGVGATAPRIFVEVLLENVLGSLVAGAIGVLIGAAVLGNGTVRAAITGGTEVGGAPFPVEAALVGVASAVAVGVLSGVLPALVAVRVKVIDAIRY